MVKIAEEPGIPIWNPVRGARATAADL